MREVARIEETKICNWACYSESLHNIRIPSRSLAGYQGWEMMRHSEEGLSLIDLEVESEAKELDFHVNSSNPDLQGWARQSFSTCGGKNTKIYIHANAIYTVF